MEIIVEYATLLVSRHPETGHFIVDYYEKNSLYISVSF